MNKFDRETEREPGAVFRGDTSVRCPNCQKILDTVLDDYETASRRFIHRYHPTPCVVPNAGARR